MRKYLLGLAVILWINGCGGSSSESSTCDYMIGTTCVTQQEKEIFNLLTAKKYYTHIEDYGDNGTSYAEIIFSEENVQVIKHIDTIERTYSSLYNWGIVDDTIIILGIAVDQDVYKVQEVRDHSIMFYDTENGNICEIWDNIDMAIEDYNCLFPY